MPNILCRSKNLISIVIQNLSSHSLDGSIADSSQTNKINNSKGQPLFHFERDVIPQKEFYSIYQSTYIVFFMAFLFLIFSIYLMRQINYNPLGQHLFFKKINVSSTY